MANRVSLKKIKTQITDEEIRDEIKKAIQLVDLFTNEKDQNWLHFRWKIWEEICRFCPIKKSQPYWPFGKLVFYNSRMILGELDTWVAQYWHLLNGGDLWLEEEYLKPFEYKKYHEYEIKPKPEAKEEIKEEKIENKTQLLTEDKIFIHSKEFTEAKYSYLSIEEKKYAKEKNRKKKNKRRKPFVL